MANQSWLVSSRPQDYTIHYWKEKLNLKMSNIVHLYRCIHIKYRVSVRGGIVVGPMSVFKVKNRSVLDLRELEKKYRCVGNPKCIKFIDTNLVL